MHACVTQLVVLTIAFFSSAKAQQKKIDLEHGFAVSIFIQLEHQATGDNLIDTFLISTLQA